MLILNRFCYLVTTKKLNKHVPCGYSINVVTNHDKKTKQVRDIVQNLINIEKKPMQEQLQEQQISHDNSQFCHIRKKVFGKKKKHVKVRDHDHYTGKYRGAAQVTCNLRYSTQINIPAFFHDGTMYDFNLIINELAKEFKSEM